MKTFPILVKTFQGLEEVLAAELVKIGATDNLQIHRRAVSFDGNQELLYKANLCLRTAIRVLKPIKTFKAASADEVYDEVKKMNWEEFLDTDKSFSIDSTVYSEIFTHSKFVTYRVKDAICDHFIEKTGKRPSVRLDMPDVMLNIHISGDTCTLSLDSSGESLHKRGYRVSQNEAPLNEALAAGLILLTGWQGDSDFIDPMCGSGTLLIEAAMIALNIPPGIYRKEFAFEKWTDFDEELFDRLYNDQSGEREFKHKIYGSDISPKAVKIAESNVKSAALGKYIELKVLPIQKLEPPANGGLLVTNPPYGERITADNILDLYACIGERLKHHFAGFEAWIISSNIEGFYKIGLKPTQRIKMLNGDLECEYRKYEIFSGKHKEYKAQKQ
ncbi:RNA methyltransferase [Bacteroidia bacterium]|nr:RNA methyltransferase [Bacteroidia bacterium]